MPSHSAGILLLFFALVCLGTWPALLDLSVLRGRHPSHTYMDYAATLFAVACVLALASSQPLFAAGWAASMLAAGGGCLLMLGNLSMQRALLMEVPLSIVLPMQGSLTVVLGTTINWRLQPERSEAHVLFIGIGAFVLAILLSATAHIAHEHDSKVRRRRGRGRKVRLCCDNEQRLLGAESRSDPAASTDTTLAVGAPAAVDPAPCSTGAAPAASASTPTTGLCVAAAGGVCFGFFSPAFNLAVNDELHWIAQSGGSPLPVFAANLWFCLAFALSAWAVRLSEIALGGLRVGVCPQGVYPHTRHPSQPPIPRSSAWLGRAVYGPTSPLLRPGQPVAHALAPAWGAAILLPRVSAWATPRCHVRLPRRLGVWHRQRGTVPGWRLGWLCRRRPGASVPAGRHTVGCLLVRRVS